VTLKDAREVGDGKASFNVETTGRWWVSIACGRELTSVGKAINLFTGCCTYRSRRNRLDEADAQSAGVIFFVPHGIDNTAMGTPIDRCRNRNIEMDREFANTNARDLNSHKAAAKRMRARLTDLGHSINLAHAYEAVAAAAGHSNWSTMIAVEKRQGFHATEVPSIANQETVDGSLTSLFDALIGESFRDSSSVGIPFGMKYYWVRHDAASRFVKQHNSCAGVLDRWPELTKEAFNLKDCLGGSFEHVIERAVLDLLMRKMEPLCEPYMRRDLEGKVAQIFLAALVFQWAAQDVNPRMMRLQGAFTAQGAATLLWDPAHASILNPHPTKGTLASIVSAMEGNVININVARKTSYWGTISNGFEEKIAGVLKDSALLANLEGYLKICTSLHRVNPAAVKNLFDEEKRAVALPECLLMR
jgi:hypothetical protein